MVENKDIAGTGRTGSTTECQGRRLTNTNKGMMVEGGNVARKGEQQNVREERSFFFGKVGLPLGPQDSGPLAYCPIPLI